MQPVPKLLRAISFCCCHLKFRIDMNINIITLTDARTLVHNGPEFDAKAAVSTLCREVRHRPLVSSRTMGPSRGERRPRHDESADMAA